MSIDEAANPYLQIWIAKETFTDMFLLLQQAEFLCVGCIEYTIERMT